MRKKYLNINDLNINGETDELYLSEEEEIQIEDKGGELSISKEELRLSDEDGNLDLSAENEEPDLAAEEKELHFGSENIVVHIKNKRASGNKTKITIRRAKISRNSRYYKENIMRNAAIAKITVFAAMLTIGAVVCLAMPLRPQYSENEKRKLAQFPQCNIGEFLSGEYFSGLDKWFSDTFPFRDTLIAFNDRVQMLCGIRKNVFDGELAAGDEIPEVDIDTDSFNEPESSQSGEDDIDNKDDNADNSGTADTANNEGEADTAADDSDENDEAEEDDEFAGVQISAGDVGTNVDKTDGTTNVIQGEMFNSVFIINNAAYDYYTFSQKYADMYIEMVNSLGTALKGSAKLYSMIVPTSIDISLNDATRNSLSSSNQRKAILYMYSRMNKNVKKTFIFDELHAHRKEYLYFRTDHHWTATGAYYAYSTFITQLGQTPHKLSEYEAVSYDGFTGSFCSQKGGEALSKVPDKLVSYKPLATNSMKLLNRSGQFVEYNIITNVKGWKSSTLYSTFIGGDNPYSEINNPDIADGSSCLVIKESFGNAFVPFLTDHFENVYIIDYRYYSGTVSKLVKEKNIDTVLLINNISATSSAGRINELKKVCR